MSDTQENGQTVPSAHVSAREESIMAALSEWVNDHLRDSPLSRDVDSLNFLKSKLRLLAQRIEGAL